MRSGSMVGAELAHHPRAPPRRIAAAVEQANGPKPRAALAAEEDVGGNVEVAAEREVLVDHLDAGGARVERAAEAHLAPVEADGSRRRRVEPERIFTSVDLPAPLSPMRPTASAAPILRSTRLKQYV